MKILPEFWIAHPAADSDPVSFKRWALWTASNWLGGVASKLYRWSDEMEHRALYEEPAPFDDIPF